MAGINFTFNPLSGQLNASPAAIANTSFKTWQVPAGTSPVATSGADTMTLSSSDGSVTITGNASTDTINFAVTTPPANKSLSNLTSPTAINQSLIPATTGVYDLGNPTTAWNTIYVNSIQFNSLIELAGGGMSLSTFNSPGTSDPISLTTGNGSSGSGSITLQTGTGSSRGEIFLLGVSTSNSGNLIMDGSSRITSLLDPSSAQDAATKNYVDTISTLGSLSLPLSQTTGNLTVSRLNSGTGASSSTFWRGDGAWSAAVTSVGLAAPAEFTVSGSPVTGSGSLTFTKASQTQNTVWAAPNGSSGAPTFRALVGADVPAINLAASGAGGVTGVVPVLNGGTGVTTKTGTGNVVLSDNATLVAPALGTPASGVATNLTGLPLSTGVTGNLSVTNLNSGTSASSSTFWRGDGAWGAAVTSVALSLPAEFAVSGSPVTGSGTLTATRPPLTATAKTGNYTLLNTDYSIKVDNTSGAFAITMPSPSSNAGHVFIITNVGSGTNLVTVSPNASETFGQQAYAALHLSTAGESWTLQSDGTNWQILNHYARTAPATFTMAITLATSPTGAPVKGTVVVDDARWWRVGDRMHILWQYQQSAAGTAGTGGITVTFGGWPTAYAISQTTSTNQARFVHGSSYIWLPANMTGIGSLYVYDTTHLAIIMGNTIGNTTGTFNLAATGTSLINFSVDFPITNWEP